MALGGALVLGALPRLLKTARFRYGLLMAIGMSILALSRPYEGMLLCLPVVFVLGRWVLFGKNQPSKSVLMRRAALPVLLVVAAVAWLGYYDYRAFGSPTTLPYTVNRAAYAMAPYYVWQSPRPEPVYRHAVMRGFYYLGEFRYFQEIHKPTGFLIQTIIKIVVGITFFSSIALLPPLIMIRRVFVDRRMRILVACLAVLIVGMGIEIFLLPHYLAPFTALFYALGLQAMRHLRLLKVEGKPVGITLVRLCVSITLGMACLRLYAGPLHLALPEQPTGAWNCIWYGPDHFGTERANVAAQLAQLPGNQLAIVRYSAKHHPMSEWVYNSYDIDNAKVIWAREMNETDNRKLLGYYKGRTVWLVQPDSLSSQVTPYPVPGHQEDVTQ
jgi:hypothetical protein